MKPIIKFLCICAGADTNLLRKYPSEIMRYTAMGITVLFTGLFAALSGGYAFYKIFHNSFLAILLGLIWGFMIFNLDRLIIMTIKKQDNFRKELIAASPRIILAIIISLVVAKPLEVKIFEDRIANVIADKEILQLNKIKSELDILLGKSENKTQTENTKSEIKTEESKLNANPKNQEFIDLKAEEKSNTKSLIKERKELLNFKEKKTTFWRSQPSFFDSISNQMIRPTKKNHLREGEWDKIVGTYGNITKSKKRIDNLKKDSLNINLKIKEIKEKFREKQKGIIEELKAQQERNKSDEQNIKNTYNELLKKYDSINKRAFSENFITQIEALAHLTKYRPNPVANINIVSVQENMIAGTVLQKREEPISTTKLEDSLRTHEKNQKAQSNLNPVSKLKDDYIEVNNSMFWMNIAIILLFVVIETSPIFVKLMSKKGEYDLEREANFSKNHSLIYSASNIDIKEDEDYEELILDLTKQSETFRGSLLQKLQDSWGYKIEERILEAEKEKDFIKLAKEILGFDLTTWIRKETSDEEEE
ncbi:DUF4407 domain-containing protein [Flavivirga aquimarina]|uniref:DUF4407 domain-containing protein n=1 Tax=Flavivirga aquimarina TaxID=2027862 RepID=A0ABT8W709_9FLAO|nr:DUF4407 domain-containing protein [Flavivirga aquimarina]MDO5968880.1 DUF4407 domain-containing protein [Flavivirga aquimarina]